MATITVTPIDSGAAVVFTSPTSAPSAGNRQFQGQPTIAAKPYAKKVLRRAYAPSVLLVFGEEEESFSFFAIWFESTRMAALQAARADCLNWGKQRCNVAVSDGPTLSAADFAGAASVNYQTFQINGVWACQFTLTFRTVP